MAGERDLQALMADLDPVLHPEELVFARVPSGRDVPAAAVAAAFAVIREEEGTTVIVPTAVAEELGLDHEMPSRRIELRVHSDLSAVGLTAAVSAPLAAHGISANVVAAFHHDHVLVPVEEADRAVEVLRQLSRGMSSFPEHATILEGEVAIRLGPSPWPPAGAVAVQMRVNGGSPSIDGDLHAMVEGSWELRHAEGLARALDAVAAGGRSDHVVGGGERPTIRFGAPGRVDGPWAVEIWAGDASPHVTARAVVALGPAVCADAAERVRAVIADVADQTS